MTSSHQLQTTDIYNESAADYAGSDVSLTEKVNIEEDESAAVAPYASENNPLEEENDALHEEVMTKNSHSIYEIESVSGANKVIFAVTETEGETVAVAIEDISFNDYEEIRNVAFETDEDIIAENIKTEAESVVEVEMLQEGLELLYPYPASDGVIIDMPVNVPNGAVDENSGQSFSGDKELSVAIDEAESESASGEVLVFSKEDSIGLSITGVDEHLLDPA
ncbi:hypothetical protein PsorP6_005054 [Peronosclerospora sorghi]|uniref:Uncharacterized protein n=1 Tax=Peronosclerospora sorghi TaxID=230839 RepID=A0ACC0W6P8_9STRA|nr:hypothetical protein PsorP6_005054 [Peronosclerospora sorghi]